MTQGIEETLPAELTSWAQCHVDVAALCQFAVPAWVVATPQRQKSAPEPRV